MDTAARNQAGLANILSEFKKNRKIDVLLLGAYGSGNVGDLAILDAMLEDLNNDKEISYSIASRDLFLKKHYNIDLINPFSITGLLRCLKKEVIVIGGGGIFGHETHMHIKIMMPFLVIAKILGKKLIFYDIGIYRAETKAMLKVLWFVMRKSDSIVLRDDTDTEIIPSDILHRAKVEPDITFALAPKEPTQREVLEFLKSSKGVVGLSLRFTNLKDPFNETDRQIATTVKQVILEEFLQQGASILFMPFQHFDLSYIRYYFRDIIDKYPEAFVILETEKYSINELKWIISKLKLAVGMRLHFQIFSTDLGVPVVGISYAPKNTNYLRKVGAKMVDAYHINKEDLRNAIRTTAEAEVD